MCYVSHISAILASQAKTGSKAGEACIDASDPEK